MADELLTQNVDVALAAGLHQEAAEQVLPAGALLVNENSEVTAQGIIRKRPGCVALPNASADTSAAPTTPVWLGAYDARGELLRVHREQSAGPLGARLYAYLEQSQSWIYRAALPSCTWSRSSLVRRQTDLGRARAQVAIDSVRRYRAVCWLEISADGESRELRFRIDDLTTGAVVMRERRVPDSEGLTESDGVFQMLYLDDRFLVVWYSQTRSSPSGPPVSDFVGWRARTDNLTADASPTAFLAAHGTVNGWDICAAPGGNQFFLAWTESDTNEELQHALCSSTWGVTTYAPHPTGGPGVTSVRCHAAEGGSGRHTVAWLSPSEGYVAVAQFDNGSPGAAALWSVVAEGGEDYAVADVYQRASDAVSLAWSVGGVSTRTREYSPTGVAIGSAPRDLPGLSLRSRQFQPWSDDRLACLLATVTEDTDPRNGGYHLVDLTTYSLTALPPQSYGSLATVGATPAVDLDGVAMPRVAYDLALDTWHVPVLVASEVYSVRQVDVIAGTAEQVTRTLWQTAEANGLLYLTGGLTAVYDGQSVVEAGFVQAPTCVAGHGQAIPGEQGLEGAGEGGNIYLYCAVDAWRDSAGNTHLGPPSAISRVVCITDPDNDNNRFNCGVTIQGPHTSRKGISPDAGANPESRPFVLIYRTKKNSSGPFYLLNGPAELPYPTNLFEVIYTDSASDEDLDEGVHPFIYTQGGVLPNMAPPPSNAACVHDGRLWLADAEDTKRLWFSKSLTPGEGPGFNLQFTLRLDDSPDGITALVSLGNELIVFTKSRIYRVSGRGPNDKGEGEYPQVLLVASSAGAINGAAVARCEKGLFFQDTSGLMLLTAVDGKPIPAGLSVQKVLREYPTIVRVVHDTARRRLVWLLADGPTDLQPLAVYDYRFDIWGTWWADPDDGNALRDQVLWRGLLVWMTTAGVFAESSNPQTDNGRWITMRVRTGWIRPGVLAGWQRTRRAAVRGLRVSSCKLGCGYYLDQQETVVQGVIWPLPSVAEQSFTKMLHLAKQKSQAVSFEFTDVPLDGFIPETGPTGVELYGLTLEMGVHPRLVALAAASRK